MDQAASYDIFVIGGGINGCGIARDAVGRGYSVYLAEMNDLASGTSSGSTKLIHGGLRYLEHYEFRLVRESLMEREVLWRMAPHIIWPLRFVLPHAEGLRPAWLLQARPVPLRPYRRAQAAAGDKDAGHAQRSGRQAAEAAFQKGIRVFGLLGERCAAGGAQCARRGRPGRCDPHARQGRRARAATATPGSIGVEDTRSGARRRGEGAAGRQCGGPVGRPRAVGRGRPERRPQCAAGAGQPYRHREEIRRSARLFLPEQGWPHHLRHSLRG